MPDILLIKTSSMGDVIHALPALTDVASRFPNARFDWLVEESFSEIPSWHPAVQRVIPIALRRMKKEGFRWSVMEGWLRELRNKTYDLVIDSQGLFKSVLLAKCSKRHGDLHGFSAASLRAKGVSWLYSKSHLVSRNLHAVERQRRLFSAALEYEAPHSSADYGIGHYLRTLPPPTELPVLASKPYLVFVQGTSWSSKAWSVSHWRALAMLVQEKGFHVYVTAGSPDEVQRALLIAEGLPKITALSPISLTKTASLLSHAHAVVALDTGLGHLAAALSVPTVALYGPTSPGLTGIQEAKVLQASFSCQPCMLEQCILVPASEPALCMQGISPHQVWSLLKQLPPMATA